MNDEPNMTVKYLKFREYDLEEFLQLMYCSLKLK